ncbi:hypothetical protein M3P36_09595 [Altererythrobacter sp. KTW20L]|uniref:hypothetical protein n=1 Tax=Altererythrobacter sp. KTW20L TaxID=2942210 RepID=UPI0020BE0AA5|nr:hypothetical protein [Altererythrobacter sp. KTW20L]MCL6251290.1 hypothetical protein [Altererythrobacter sp. KTW20L]
MHGDYLAALGLLQLFRDGSAFGSALAEPVNQFGHVGRAIGDRVDQPLDLSIELGRALI